MILHHPTQILPLFFHPWPQLSAHSLPQSLTSISCSPQALLFSAPLTGSWPQGSTIRVWREECEGWGERGVGLLPPFLPEPGLHHGCLPLSYSTQSGRPLSYDHSSGWVLGIAHPFSFVSPGPRMMEASAVNSSQWLLHSSWFSLPCPQCELRVEL